MAIEFKKATKSKAKLRLMLQGPAGSGKTTAALVIGTTMGSVAYIDTERGSASLYSDKFEFDVLELDAPFEPEKYVEAIKAAESAGYDVIVIDSLSHEWVYILEMATKLGGAPVGWKAMTPRHDKLVESILQSKCHIISCARSKTEYAYSDGKDGKAKVQKLGLAAQQREGLDYEMSIVFEINQDHIAQVSKDRSGLFNGKQFEITTDTAHKMLDWLNTGAEVSVSHTPTVLDICNNIKNIESLKELGEYWKTIKEFQANPKVAEAKNIRKGELTA